MDGVAVFRWFRRSYMASRFIDNFAVHRLQVPLVVKQYRRDVWKEITDDSATCRNSFYSVDGGIHEWNVIHIFPLKLTCISGG